MNTRINLALGGALLLALGGLAAYAQNSRGKWQVLFDGKSASAWRGYKSDSFPANSWKVEDGALTTIVGPGPHSDIITREKFQDFELELEWKVAPGGNSGIMYRVSEDYDNTYHSGPEMQVLDDAGHPDAKRGIAGNRTAGSLYDLIAPTNKVPRPAGEFNKVRLVVRGNHVEHWLNGRKVVEYELGSEQMNKLIAASKFNVMPGFAKQKEGHIALQHHGDPVWYRNIRIRRLDARR